MVENPQFSIPPQKRHPEIIQGGMGVGVSNWELAKSSSMGGAEIGRNVLGVVSGTGLAVIMAERLSRNDPNTIRALHAFNPQIAEEIINEFTPKDGKLMQKGQYKLPPKPETLVNGSEKNKKKIMDLTIAAAFTEVYLAKENNEGKIGINLLEKTQLPILPTLLGAMMADVDTVLVGAGLPLQIPGILDCFSRGEKAMYKLDVAGSSEKYSLELDPKSYLPEGKTLKRPDFYGIVSLNLAANVLMKKSSGEVNGIIVENYKAGGHNAPPRGKEINEATGEPIYRDKDNPKLEELMELGVPVWLAGGYATAEQLKEAQKLGAAGVQVGSAFALSRESGLRKEVKDRLIDKIKNDKLNVLTSAKGSPSGFPFQVVQLSETLSEKETYESRKRVCTMGHLVEAFSKDGSVENIGFRCPAEPVDAFLRKGGDIDKTNGSICLCTGLGGAADFGRSGRNGEMEPFIVTLGKDLSFYSQIPTDENGYYSAKDVVKSIFSTEKN